MFLFGLAKELGMTVQLLLSSLDSREITEWQAYFKIVNEEMKKDRKKDKDVPLDAQIMAKFPTKAGVKAGRR